MRLRGVWLCGLGMALAVTVACGGGGQEKGEQEKGGAQHGRILRQAG